MMGPVSRIRGIAPETPRSGLAQGGRLPTRAALPAAATAALLGIVVALAVTARVGPGITPDSVVYLSAAQSLLDGDGLRGPDGEPYVAFPPLFPALIALATLGVVEPADAARVLVALSFGIAILASGWIAGWITGSRVVAAVTGLAVLVSIPLLDASLHIWSETPFTALTMLCLSALSVGSLRRQGPAHAAATVAAALASLTRYIGVMLTLTQLVTIVSRTDASVREKLRRAGTALLALAPLLIWAGRNVLVSGTVAGERFLSADPLVVSARDAAEVMLRWLVPIDAPMRGRALVVLLLVASLVVRLMLTVRGREERSRELFRACLPFAVFCLFYLFYLVGAASLTALDPIDDRLIAPVVPAAVVLSASAIHAAWFRPGMDRLRAGGAIAGIVIGLWLLASSADAVRFVRDVDAHGMGGYAARAWRESETLRFIREEAPQGVLYSNDPFAINYWTGRDSHLSPRRHPYRSPNTTVDDLPKLRGDLASGRPVYLVWFDAIPRDFLWSISELDIILELQPMARLDDGGVYRVTRADDAALRVSSDERAANTRVPFWSTR